MGLSASQARLLSITARLSDNELQSQQIANSKVRLADKSQEAGREYIEALDATKLMYNAFDMMGNATQVNLNAASLYEYSPYKNQYTLVNTNNQLLVSATDAANYNETTDLMGFLDRYGVLNVEETEALMEANTIATTTYTSNLEKYNSALSIFNDANIPAADKISQLNNLDSTYASSFADILEYNEELEKFNSDYAIYEADMASYNKAKTAYENSGNAYTTYNTIYGYQHSDTPDVHENDLYYCHFYDMITYNNSKNEYFTDLANYQTEIEEYNKLYDIYQNGPDTDPDTFLQYAYDALGQDSESSYIQGFCDVVEWNQYESQLAAWEAYEQSVENHDNWEIQNTKYQQYTIATKNFEMTYTAGDFQLACDSHHGVENYTDEYVEYYLSLYESSESTGNTNGVDATKKANTYNYLSQYSSGVPTSKSYKDLLICLLAGESDSGFTITSTDGNTVSFSDSEVQEARSNWYNSGDTISDELMADMQDILNTSPYYINGTEYTGSLKDDLEDILCYICGGIFYINTVQNNYSVFVANLNSLDVVSEGSTEGVPEIEIPTDPGEEPVVLEMPNFEEPEVRTEEAPVLPDAPEVPDIEDYGAYAAGEPEIDLPSPPTYHDIDPDTGIYKYPLLHAGKPKAPTPPTMPEITNAIVITDQAKAQWYVNLWYRMNGSDTANMVNQMSVENSNGAFEKNQFTVLAAKKALNSSNYKIIDENLYKSSEWLQYALEQGIVTIQKATVYDPSEDNGKVLSASGEAIMWTRTPHTSCTDFISVDDEIAIAKAEAEYKRKTDQIQAEDKRLDNDLKKLDTEHNALQTEYESVKSVVSKNIERSFKAFS